MTILRDADHGRGQALVEFALLIPLMLLLLVAVFDMGRAVFAYNSITNAAREAARLAIVNQDATSIQQRGISQTAIGETAAPNLTVTFRKAIPNVDPLTNPVCTPIEIDCIAVVRYQTTYRPITPIINRIIFGNGVTLTARTDLPVEFVCPNSSTVAANCPKQP